MLAQIGKHGAFDLKVHADGDLYVDEHHTIEDTAIVLGHTLREALGDKMGIERYGFVLPMDDSLCTVALDFWRTSVDCVGYGIPSRENRRYAYRDVFPFFQVA